MSRFHSKNSNNIKDEASIFSPEPISPAEIDSENYLDVTQDKDFKRTTTNFIQEFKVFKEDSKKQFNRIKGKELREKK